MDIITRYSNGQVITTDDVSDLVNSFPTDEARNVFMNKPYLVKALVAVVAAGGAEGIRIEFRWSTTAALTGAPIVTGDSGILLPTQLETVGKIHEFRVRPIRLQAGYDFCGIYYNIVTSAFSGGFALTTWLADEGSEAGIQDPQMTI